MKAIYFLLVLVILILLPHTVFAQKYRNDLFSETAKSLRVQVADNWKAFPVVALNSEEWVEINFDLLNAQPERLTYTLTHCDAEWRSSDLIPSQYMNGFQHTLIDDYIPSFNTTMDYVNYRITLPNENVSFKISGNYVVQVFSEESDFPLLTACFSVVDPGISISAEVTPLTDKGMNSRYQAVNFEVNYEREHIRVPMQELKVFVRQNNRLDNEARLVKPLTTQNRTLVYQHNPELIFDAGNEYRKFEMTTHGYSGLGIDTYEFHPPYFHALLTPGKFRTHTYFYDEDINGRFLIRTLQSENWDTDGDYRFVHFYLDSENPLKEDVYILGNLFNNILDERSRMTYSEEEKCYTKTTLLKEGYYNYLYVTRDKDNKGNTNQIEGNYFQTENEYQVFVYFRPLGERYDQLVGFKTIQYQ